MMARPLHPAEPALFASSRQKTVFLRSLPIGRNPDRAPGSPDASVRHRAP
ncbi:MAG: hypothetical protein AVDCRST_MAG55-2680 [uncultured Rubrobacteraceae bacterium]|uniref:Uncharacterized protein n=1 Tax=uncultured Rubrobacteraceae bacterium TaxID=349277 RepID=A0A6J4Q5Q0_9ACTN|nr:MAG: hypothetical protein AVDCRST_MAG55-2680 [uncultured Rubrobacteraceae bacterium]